MNLSKRRRYSYKKWDMINRDKYPREGIVDEFIFGECLPYIKVLGYMKNDILFFYWGVGKSKFRGGSNSDYKNLNFSFYKEAFKIMKNWIEKNNYTGSVGFELCELEQLNIIVEYMLRRNGYTSERKEKYLFISRGDENKSQNLNTKLDVINKNKYPIKGIANEYIIGNCLPYKKIVGYMKNDILLFHWGIRVSKFHKINTNFINVNFILYKKAIRTIKNWIEKNNYTGPVGFELCELEQLNIIVEYMLRKNGYKSERKNNFLIVSKKL